MKNTWAETKVESGIVQIFAIANSIPMLMDGATMDQCIATNTTEKARERMESAGVFDSKAPFTSRDIAKLARASSVKLADIAAVLETRSEMAGGAA